MLGMCLTTLNADAPTEGIQLSWYACAIPGGLAQNSDLEESALFKDMSNPSISNLARMQQFTANFAGLSEMV